MEMLTDAGLFRDLVQLRNIAPSVFTPVPAKHAKSFNLIDTLAVRVDRIQRSFETDATLGGEAKAGAN